MLRRQLIRHEGLRLKPYKDTVGKLTIGVGRNLDDVGITEQEAMILLDNDIERTKLDLLKALPWINKIDSVRQDVLINMAFNMGIGGLLGFKNTLASVQSGNYADAADKMLQSKWAGQVGLRASELSNMMRTGKYPDG